LEDLLHARIPGNPEAYLRPWVSDANDKAPGLYYEEQPLPKPKIFG
jgi:hypothetical protein